ncbi:MAG: PAS domain S-box protein [Calditrichaeota bacterium]|nr:MAG: PAS domain S-box protein [Calditrichota bacterium]
MPQIGIELKQLFASGLIDTVTGYLYILVPILTLISLYLGAVWLQLQSRFYFLSIVVANTLMLGYELLVLLSPSTTIPGPNTSYLHLSFHVLILVYLAVAPSIPEKISADLTTLLKKNFWLLLSLLLLPAAYYLDIIQFQLPDIVKPVNLWIVLIIPTISLMIFRLLRHGKFKAYDAVTYILMFTGFAIASWLDRFQSTNYALFALAPANGLFIYLLLRNHRHSVVLEAELRSGLLEQNQTLRSENQIHEHILKFSREAILRIDRDDHVTYCNSAFEQLTDLKLDDVQQQKLNHVLSQNFYDAAQPALKSARRGKCATFDIKLSKRDGEEKAFTVYAEPLLDARQKFNGTHLGFVDITMPISQRDALDSRLSQQGVDLEMFRMALTMTDEALVLTDNEEHILLINKAFTRLTGYGAADLLGQSTQFYRLKNKHGEGIWQTLQQGKSWQGEMSNKRKDGSRLETDVIATPILDEKGTAKYILWTEKDAAIRKNYKKEKDELHAKIKGHREAYHNLEEQIDVLFSIADNGILLLRPEGTCAFMNQKAVQLLGYSKDELPIKKLPGFVKDMLRMEASYGDKLEMRLSDYQDVFVRPDGKRVTFRWRGTPVWSKTREPLGVVLHISEIHQTAVQDPKAQDGEPVISHSRDAAIDQTKYNELLDLSEMLNANGDDGSIAAGLRTVSESLKWPRFIFYEKNFQSSHYELLHSAGFQPKVQRHLKSLSCESVDQYLNSRFAFGKAFFLSEEKLEPGQKNWVFAPPNLTFQTPQLWHPRDVLLQPLYAKGKQVGLLLLGEPSESTQLTENSLLFLDKFAQQLAFYLHRKIGSETERLQQKRSELLLELSRLETENLFSARFLENILKKIRAAINAEVCILTKTERPVGICSQKSSRNAYKTTHFTNPEVVLNEIQENRTQKSPDQFKKIYKKMGFTGETEIFVNRQKMLCKRRDYGLILCARENDPFSREEQNYVQELAAQLARLIENSQLFDEIEAKAAELEKANVLISEFLANVSHELRTPLHAILSYVELLRQKGKAPEAERTRHLETIRRSGKKLLNLINDLLDLHKIEAGKIEPKPSVFSPRELMQNIEREIRPLCDESGLNLTITVHKNVQPYIRTDIDMLERVVLNLARNAQKYTENGSVEIFMAMSTKTDLHLEVKDTGIGIPKSAQATIFEPFQQLEGHGQIRHKGSGLGLAISKSIIDLLSGNIAVESEAGKGARFTIDVPVKPMSRKPRQKSSSKAKPAKKKKTHKKGSLILLVDDDESTREAMRFLLENAGYQVEFASDGEKAITLAQRLRPDLILLDVMMPGMDGLQTTRVLKSQKQLRDIPVIALTARAMQEDRENAMDAGCDDFLSKPFEMDVFLDLVGKYI